MSVIAQKFVIANSLLLLTLLTACSRSTINEEFKKEQQSVSSWSATAQMVGNAWFKGSLPNQYAQQTLHKTQAELLKAREKILKNQIASNDNQHYQYHVLQIANQTEEISQAIAQNNRLLVQTEMQKLNKEIDRLNQLK